MLRIDSSLRRLKDNVDHFVVPSIALRDVRMLEAQIEFRRQALREIEVIRCQLRPFMRGDLEANGYHIAEPDSEPLAQEARSAIHRESASNQEPL